MMNHSMQIFISSGYIQFREFFIKEVMKMIFFVLNFELYEEKINYIFAGRANLCILSIKKTLDYFQI